MCKSRDPFFYTCVIVRARCARYNFIKSIGVMLLFYVDINKAIFSLSADDGGSKPRDASCRTFCCTVWVRVVPFSLH